MPTDATVAPGLAACLAPAHELARRLRAGELGALELTDAYLERIERRDDELNAYVTVLGEEARRAARAADARRARGEALGPLHGLPVAIKDLYDLKAGVRHTFGSALFADHVAAHDAITVTRLERAGAIVLGKTNTSELGHCGATDNRVTGPTSTPLAPGRNAGGSSGGSAAAVAAGLAAAATGSDGAGSLRIPAAFCEVCALKPTQGRIAVHARPNAFRSQAPFAQFGPIGRATEDLALLLSVLAGPHARDPLALAAPPADWLARRADQPLRVAFSADLGGFAVEPVVAEVVADAMRTLDGAGAIIEPIDLVWPRPPEQLHALLRRLLGVLLSDALSAQRLSLEDPATRAALSPQIVRLVDDVQTLRAVDFKADEWVRTGVLDAIEDVLSTHDVLVSPAVGTVPFPNEPDGSTLGPDVVAGRPVDPLLGWALAFPINFSGHPAACVPAGRTTGGLPVGLQIVGRRFDEATVLAAAAMVEHVRPWPAALGEELAPTRSAAAVLRR